MADNIRNFYEFKILIGNVTVSTGAGASFISAVIDESIEGLNPLEKAVIENRYKNDYTQEETASRVGLSQSKVSRIESRSKVKIRNFIAS